MKSRKRGILVFFAAMLFITGISRAMASFTVAQVEVVQPGPGKIVHTVIGSGVVNSMKRQAVYVAADVLVEEVIVQQGQNVRKGDVLMRLDSTSLREKISRLSHEIKSMQIQDMEIAAAKERAKTRAREDYDNTVSENKRKIERARENVRIAERTFRKVGRQKVEKETVKASEEALKEAREALEDTKYQAEIEKRQAKRNLEDVFAENTDGSQPETDQMDLADKEKQLATLEALQENGGNVMAQVEGTVMKIQLEAGEKTGDTAAVFMSVASGGMSFSTEISKEDAIYVKKGDMVTLKTAEKEYEELSVTSVEADEETDCVKVTVFVPKNTISPGEHADMMLTKASGEYGTILPISAIRTENEKNFVYVMALEETVLGEQYVVKSVDVTVAERDEMSVALTNSELEANSQVIISSDRMISVGERVRLKEGAGE